MISRAKSYQLTENELVEKIKLCSFRSSTLLCSVCYTITFVICSYVAVPRSTAHSTTVWLITDTGNQMKDIHCLLSFRSTFFDCMMTPGFQTHHLKISIREKFVCFIFSSCSSVVLNVSLLLFLLKVLEEGWLGWLHCLVSPCGRHNHNILCDSSRSRNMFYDKSLTTKAHKQEKKKISNTCMNTTVGTT